MNATYDCYAPEERFWLAVDQYAADEPLRYDSPISLDDLRRMPGPEAAAYAKGVLAMLQRQPSLRREFSLQDLAYLELIARDVDRYAAEEAEEDDEQERIGLIADIVSALFGDHADLLFSADEYDGGEPLRYGSGKPWNAVDHPRGKDGRFIPKGSPEAVATAKAKVSEVLKGKRDAETQKKLIEHLNILTVKQLHDFKKEHGLSASGPRRDELLAKLTDRLARGRMEGASEEAEQQETKHPVAKQKKIVADTLREHLGDNADAVAREIGLELNGATLQYQIKKAIAPKKQETAPEIASRLSAALLISGLIFG